MCLSRTTSSFRVPHLGRLEDVIPEVTAQLGWCSKIDPPPQKRGELPLHRGHRQVPGSDALTEFHENVYVAVRPEVVPENRPEEAQLPEPVFPAERLDGCLVEIDPCHGTILAPGGSLDGQGLRAPPSPGKARGRCKNRYAPRMVERSQVRGLDVIVEQDSDGWFVGSVPSLAGCHTQARTRGELRDRVAEAIDLCLEADLPTGPDGLPSNR